MSNNAVKTEREQIAETILVIRSAILAEDDGSAYEYCKQLIDRFENLGPVGPIEDLAITALRENAIAIAPLRKPIAKSKEREECPEQADPIWDIAYKKARRTNHYLDCRELVHQVIAGDLEHLTFLRLNKVIHFLKDKAGMFDRHSPEVREEFVTALRKLGDESASRK